MWMYCSRLENSTPKCHGNTLTTVIYMAEETDKRTLTKQGRRNKEIDYDVDAFIRMVQWALGKYLGEQASTNEAGEKKRNRIVKP